MKTIIINASPRKIWCSAQILKSALKGAQEAGAETEYVDLYDLAYSGCRSCLACKRRGIENPCKCYWKDGLSPILERVCEADRLIAASPVYFGEPTAGFRAFLERLAFPALSYDNYLTSQYTGSLDIAVFLTMNVNREFYDRNYAEKMADYFMPFRFLNGKLDLYPVCDTLQVNDYSKYDMRVFDGGHKKELYEKEFPAVLDLAYRVGKGK